jgi:DNA-binding response OmpR family regulator
MKEGYGYGHGNGLGQELITSTKRIMLIDDNHDIGLSFKIVLEHYYGSGIKVESFASPLTALENFKTGLYDLAIIDTKLPYMSGFEVYRKLKELDRKVKVCFLVPDKRYEDATKRLFPELGLSSFIQIPIPNEALIRKVRTVLG